MSELGFKNRSQWIRHRLQGKKTPVPVQLKTHREALGALYQQRFELHQIGKNLNQLVALAHAQKIHSTEDFDDTLNRLSGWLERNLDEVGRHVGSLEDLVRGAET